MIKFLVFLSFFVFITELSAQSMGEDLTLDLSIREVTVNNGDHYPEMGQEISISCAQYLSPVTDRVEWNSVVGYFFSRSHVFDSTAVLMATDESSLGGRIQDEFDPEMATITLPDSIEGVLYVYIVADAPHTFSHLEKGLENNIVKIPLIIQEIPSGIQDEEADLLVFYPNPVSNVLNVKTHSREREQVFEIFDTSGAMVKRVPSSQGSTSSIDVSDLVAGMYFIHASGMKRFQKLIIN